MDIIITTADPVKEPLIITANTVLSVLAIDYPIQKIKIKSPAISQTTLLLLITFYSLVETVGFAKRWVPFCKKFDIETRAPFMYFSKQSLEHSKKPDPNFLREWQEMKVFSDAHARGK